LNQTVGKRRLAVVDVRDDREISDVLHGPDRVWAATAVKPSIIADRGCSE
jgi:FlaA1/EpsC-like NDP-sugar epimerase